MIMMTDTTESTRRQIAATVESFRCPCCGDDVMGIRPICSDCTDAGCEMTRDATGELGWWECQRVEEVS